VKVTFDKSVNAVYIYTVATIPPGRVGKTVSVDLENTSGQLNIDMDDTGKILGIEILGASNLLPDDFFRQFELL